MELITLLKPSLVFKDHWFLVDSQNLLMISFNIRDQDPKKRVHFKELLKILRDNETVIKDIESQLSATLAKKIGDEIRVSRIIKWHRWMIFRLLHRSLSTLTQSSEILSVQQQEALSILSTGRNAWITGKPGTGKTMLLSSFLSRCDPSHTVALASSGMAAWRVFFNHLFSDWRHNSTFLCENNAKQWAWLELLHPTYRKQQNGSKKQDRERQNNCNRWSIHASPRRISNAVWSVESLL